MPAGTVQLRATASRTEATVSGFISEGVPPPRKMLVTSRGPVRAPDRAWGRVVDMVVDEPATRGEIDLKLAALERLALERGPAGALGYAGEASPVLVDRIAVWAGGLEGRGLAWAPVSAMIRRPAAGEAAAQRQRAGAAP